MIVKEKVQIDSRDISFEVGRVAKQSSGSVLVQMGDSVVLTTACVSDLIRNVGFFPLSCDYIEKTFAAGKIPGGFFKREGRPSTHEILSSRLIDRPCRPLFPKGFLNEVQIIATVLSADAENATDVMAVCGASLALTLSDIPWDGPIAAAKIGLIDGQYVFNPTYSELEKSSLDIVVASGKDAIVMVEGEAKEVDEETLIGAFFFAFDKLKPIIDLQLKLQASMGKPKRTYTPRTIDPAFVARVEEKARGPVEDACRIPGKKERQARFSDIVEQFTPEISTDPSEGPTALDLEEVLFGLKKHALRTGILERGVRADGRRPDEIRTITCEVGILPRVHGSGLFTRGETQAIVAATLGTKGDEQRIDDLLGERSKRFMLHYNFPPYSVGEVKFLRGPSRREIGHGNLAERSFANIIPDQASFPYTIRVVSEILESNGSSSMATVCGATLSLMDAGVPIKAPVAGIAMGLVMDEATGKYVVLSDILGDEDHVGDMDFKVTGTRTGITGMQMDIKVKGLSREVLSKALEQARVGRTFILDRMTETIPTYRPELSTYAPRVTTIKIKPDKIREIIGPGGKVIRALEEQTGATIEVEDDGTVNVFTPNKESMDKAIALIQDIVREAEVGVVYEGTVRSIKDFGAFVEILPGTDGLVHISELAPFRVKTVEEVCKEGDKLTVRCIGIDQNGKIRLTHKEFYKGAKPRDGRQGGRQG
jgi:polyribonucleotide nucleotidyltransferase